MFHVVVPLSFVDLAIRPDILSLTLHFILNILPFIDTSIGKYFMAVTLSLVHSPITIVALSTVIQHDTLPFPSAFHKLSVIYSLFIFF